MRRNNRVVLRAEEMIGAPYRHLGRGRHGIDCLGLMLFALEIDEDTIPEIQQGREMGYYKDRKWLRSADALEYSSLLLAACLTKHLLTIQWADRKPGDVAALRFKVRQGPDHVGIIDRGDLIHADIRRGVVRDPIEGRIEQAVIGVYRRE